MLAMGTISIVKSVNLLGITAFDRGLLLLVYNTLCIVFGRAGNAC